MSILVSEFFTTEEFRCHDGTPYPEDWIADRLTSLCRVLDALRSQWGGPLNVVSGYRTAAFNARLAEASSGVAKNSQHIQGRAADVRPVDPTRERVFRLHRLALWMYADGTLPDLGGLGVYPGWIHVDVRSQPTGALAQWTGVGVGSEVT